MSDLAGDDVDVLMTSSGTTWLRRNRGQRPQLEAAILAAGEYETRTEFYDHDGHLVRIVDELYPALTADGRYAGWHEAADIHGRFRIYDAIFSRLDAATLAERRKLLETFDGVGEAGPS